MEKSQKPASTTMNFRKVDFLQCDTYKKVSSNGVWFHDSPFNHSGSLLLVQLIPIFFLTRIISLLLKPLRQSKIVAPIIAGIIIGTSIHEHKDILDVLFSPSSRLILQTFLEFGFMIHLFVLGVHVDAKLLKSIGGKAAVIGILGLLPTVVITLLLHGWMEKSASQEALMTVKKILPVSLMNSVTYFIVIADLLMELKILNSDLGRLACATSMTSDAVGWFWVVVVDNMRSSISHYSWKPIWACLSIFGYYFVICFILRPVVLYFIRKSEEGNHIKESHFYTIIIFVLGVGFCGEVLGQHGSFGCFMFGLFLPAGPPLGTVIVQKLSTFSSGLLFPAYCAVSGLRTDLFDLPHGSQLVLIELIYILSYIGKFTGTILSSLCFGISFSEASLLALIMSCKGIIELGLLNLFMEIKVITPQMYTLWVINMLIVVAIVFPIVSYLYDPLRRYNSYQRRTILHSKKEVDLRMLVCIHGESNVPSVINLIEVSNPTRSNPITLYVLQLIELTGRATSVLVSHDKQKDFTNYEMSRSEPIVNAFKHFEEHNHMSIVLQHFTAIAPYASMQNDVCNIAMDKRISILILPFHKQWKVDGTEDSNPHIRALNINVINKAPCTVGILIDKTQVIGNHQPIFTLPSLYRIAMLFVGGPDDEEALIFSRRMAEHPNISLMVVWFKPLEEGSFCKGDKNHDVELMDEFRANAVGNRRITYREVTVEDGSGTTEVIHSMENNFDLFVVGKHHRSDSIVMFGLDNDTQWGEFPELGIIGDMLVTSDYLFSVLVVQQQPHL